jgi:predicted Rossmann fold flavoprotein
LRIAIIGGGAAGMVAAVLAKQTLANAEIVLFEKNLNLGAKVAISGGGRCNVTTGIQDLTRVLSKYPRGAKFLRYAMHSFSPEMVFAWFEKQGCSLKCESDMRVFPVSDNGADVIAVFSDFFAQNKVQVCLDSQVVALEKLESGKFEVSLKSGENFSFDKVILTTGGQAYRHTGSSGDGYAFAEKLGHSLTDLGPSLNSFVLEEKWLGQLSGISFENCGLQANLRNPIKTSGKAAASSLKQKSNGPVLISHKGLTGPAVFEMSALTAFETISKESALELYLDFIPKCNQLHLENQVFDFVKNFPQKYIKQAFYEFLPRRLVDLLASQYHFDFDRASNSVAHKDIRKFLQLVKHFKVHVISRAAGDEFVTAGGIELSEIDPKTMQSKICPGLFFAGEILNIDGYTGGFNLQSAWATGFVAGSSLDL